MRMLRVRKGAVAVEFALVLPLIVLLLGGGLELGRAVMVQHVLEETARAGCRVAVLEDSTKQDTVDFVDQAMLAAGITNYTVTVDPDPPVDLPALTAVTVTVTVNYGDVSWFSLGIMSGKKLTGACVLPAEGGNSS